MGHSSSNCRKIVGANDTNWKKVVAPSFFAEKCVRPPEEAPSAAEKSATFDKQQWVPKAASTDSIAVAPNTKTQTSDTAGEKSVQCNIHPVRLPLSNDVAGTSQKPDVVEVLEMQNTSAEKVQEDTLHQALAKILHGTVVTDRGYSSESDITAVTNPQQ